MAISIIRAGIDPISNFPPKSKAKSIKKNQACHRGAMNFVSYSRGDLCFDFFGHCESMNFIFMAVVISVLTFLVIGGHEFYFYGRGNPKD